MKKLAVLTGLIIAVQGVNLSAQSLSKQALRTAISEQIADSQRISSTVTNKGVSKQERNFTLHITEDLYYQGTLSGAYQAKLPCRGYALNANWLIIPGTCMRQDNGKIFNNEGWTRGQRYVDIEASGANGYAYNKHLLLVWYDQRQFRWPFVNVLAVSQGDQLYRLANDNTVIARREIYGSRASYKMVVRENTFQSGLFQVGFPGVSTRGAALDTLLLLSPEGNEFLLGYNTGWLHYDYEQTSRYVINPFESSPYWYSLTEEDLQFIKDTVLENRPHDWERIQNQLFLNNPVIPYFH